MSSPTKAGVFGHGSLGQSGLSETNHSLFHRTRWCAACFTQCLQGWLSSACCPAGSTKGTGKGEGRAGLPWLWAHRMLSAHWLWFSLSLFFPVFFVSEAPLQLAGQHAVLEKGFFSVFLELIKMTCQFSSYSDDCVAFMLVNRFVGNMPVVKIVYLKLQEGFLC